MYIDSKPLWAFNALAKLKLTANVTFYDCVCISTCTALSRCVLECGCARECVSVSCIRPTRSSAHLAPHLVSIMQMPHRLPDALCNFNLFVYELLLTQINCPIPGQADCLFAISGRLGRVIVERGNHRKGNYSDFDSDS